MTTFSFGGDLLFSVVASISLSVSSTSYWKPPDGQFSVSDRVCKCMCVCFNTCANVRIYNMPRDILIYIHEFLFSLSHANTLSQKRCCYKYKQKKTNPHLLRDMIVTHVRKNGDASEKELEALALFMGHSIQMQRDSYDRRTLEQKVSPAVKLMKDMNSLGGGVKE